MIRNIRSEKLDEIHYLLGNSCNLNCDFCFWDSRLPNFPIEFKKKIVDQIISTGIKKVTVSGGEPLCDKDFMDILTYMHKAGLEIVLHTNGLKITQRSLKKIAAFISRISLTMDSVDEDILFQMRKNRDITQHTIFLVKQFHKLGVPVSIKTLVTKVNHREIVNIGKVLSGLPIQYWSLFEFVPIGRGKTNKDKFYINPKPV
ncbi:radical SAM protein [Candidatus Shapirobacteria bacterium]|nr:radical SAM protein [Candidatus Shapirobacteria bacterium]